MPVQRVLTEYVLPDLYEPKRWMCSKCGLILDYLFSPGEAGWPEFQPPLHAVDYFEDEHGAVVWEEPEREERCPRCNINFDETPLIPVVIKEFTIRPFAKATFVVEDKTQYSVIQNIANQLGKDIEVLPVGNSENVKRFFEHLKDRGFLENGYFIIDGDNKSRIYPDEDRFIHLEKYCMENYLLDFEVCSIVVNKTVDEIKHLILTDLKSVIIQSNNILAILSNILTIDHINETTLSNLDCSKVLPRLLAHLGPHIDEYIRSYVEVSIRQERLDVVFSKKLIDSIKSVV